MAETLFFHVSDIHFGLENNEALDWFSAEVTRLRPAAIAITGDLTMLGETHPVTLDITLNKAAEYPISHEEYTLGVSASTTIQRSQWGMTYALDPLVVGDEVDLRFEFEAIEDGDWF